MLERYATSPDGVGITQWAEKADTDAMLRWLTGTWIQADSYYYRPLSSYLFWREYRPFGWNFQGHAVVSWLLHAAISLCVYFLALRVFPPSGRLGVVTALIAVALFNLRLTPSGPHWSSTPVAYSVVAWWPAQTDQASLLFSLLALLSLDRWLQGDDRRGLVKAGALWVVAVLFKEMAVILPAVAALLIVLRRGWSSLAVTAKREDGTLTFGLGLFWRVILPLIAVVALFLAARPLIVPGAWGMKTHTLIFWVRKMLALLAPRQQEIIFSRGAWPVVAGAFSALCVAAWIRAPRRPEIPWLIIALVIGNGLIAQLVGGNFALLTVPNELAGTGTMFVLALGTIVIAHIRDGWPWALLAMALVVHLPLIDVWGPHYFYRPAAFWALFNASLWHWTLLRAPGGALQWRSQPAPATVTADE